jgi:hypothetical protein
VRRSQLVEAWVDSEEIGSAVWQGGSTPPSLPMNIKIEITEEQLWRIRLSLQQSIVSAERTLEEFGGDYPHARLANKAIIEECKELLTKLEQI